MELLCCVTSSVNWQEIFVSTVIGGVLGYFISIWASSNYEKSKFERTLKDLNKQFAGHAGFFENYYHKGQKISTKISDARIEYILDKGKSFKITVTTYTDGNANLLSSEEIQIWEGEINMVDKRFGDISYNFVTPERLKLEVGFKRIIFSSDLLIMTLVGERPRYEDERFERKNNH